jgi:hypothetical protein
MRERYFFDPVNAKAAPCGSAMHDPTSARHLLRTMVSLEPTEHRAVKVDR